MRRRILGWIVVGVVLVVLAAILASDAEPAPTVQPKATTQPDPSRQPTVSAALTGAVQGQRTNSTRSTLVVNLSEGAPSLTESVPAIRRADGRVLSADEIRQVTNRLPTWDVTVAGDSSEFNRPAETLKPPRVGDTINNPFVTAVELANPEEAVGPLEVLRVQPQGEVEIAPFVSITFNQAMVPLTTVAQIDAANVPVRLSPELPGRWQWIGTRTLRFEHDPQSSDRLPMSTSYVVEIPAGTKSLAGSELAETVQFEFQTPAASLAALIPRHESIDLQQLFVATFNQRVNPTEVLKQIALEVAGEQYPVRLATETEVAADAKALLHTQQAVEGTWVAFRPTNDLPRDSRVEIKVGPHVRSAEGPNTSSEMFLRWRRTYGPLQVRGHECDSFSVHSCTEGSLLLVRFNNVLDAASLNVSEVKISPALRDKRIAVRHDSLEIVGATLAGTDYEVELPASLVDEYGQTLGSPTVVEFGFSNAEPFLQGPRDPFVILDPNIEAQQFSAMVRGHQQLRVRLFDVLPSDLSSYERFWERWQIDEEGMLGDPPWTLVNDRVIDTGLAGDADVNAIAEVQIDVGSALEGERGHVIAIVEGVGDFATITYDDRNFWTNRPLVVWVQDTHIGVDMLSHNDNLLVWTTDLRSGTPLANVTLEFVGRTTQSVSDDEGLARLSMRGRLGGVLASLGNDSAINVGDLHLSEANQQLIWYVTDDRGTYRPGETVHIKGWIRNLNLSEDGSLELLPSGQSVRYSAYDWHGNQLAESNVRLDEHGGFDLAIELPQGANLGHAGIEFSGLRNSFHYHPFQIQEFRRPEFEVSTRFERAGPFLVNEPTTAVVDARYFSSGPLPNAPVTWSVDTQRGEYSPPNWGAFTFGVWQPWWARTANYYVTFSDRDTFGDYGGYGSYPGAEADEAPATFLGRTDASGSHYLRMDFAGDGDQLPTMVTAQAEVLDLNRQQWADSSGVLVHAAEVYVGIRSTGSFVRSGEGFEVEAIVTDIDGNPLAGRPFEIVASRLISDFVDGEWLEIAVEPESCEVISSTTPVECQFAGAIGGRYRIDAKVTDDEGRSNRSELSLWVAGATNASPNSVVELETVQLIADAESYAVGDTAEILVLSPFESASGLMVVTGNGTIESRTFAIDDYSTVLEVPINADQVPELTVNIELVGSAVRADDNGELATDSRERPAFAAGQVRLRVPPLQRALNVLATPDSAVLEPGSRTQVTLEVTNSQGSAVEGANVLLIVVDEAVLAVSGYELLDPLEVFYEPRFVSLRMSRSRDLIALASSRTRGQRLSAGTSGDMESDASFPDSLPATSLVLTSSDAETAPISAQNVPIDVRENLDALAVFDPDVTTNANGVATVAFNLPDSLTRYRVMAVAVDGPDRFGSTESTITARLPVQVRPSAPRFLNFGDRFELPVIVQNTTATDVQVDVVVQASNLVLEGAVGRQVTVPANDRVEVRFRAAANLAGTARLRVAAVSSSGADAQELSIPVYTPASSEAFATYGVLDSGVVSYALEQPQDVLVNVGGLEIDTSSTALQALTDAVLYLTRYRYSSATAYASRILAIAALRDVLEAFSAESLPTPEKLDSLVRLDIKALTALQHEDGAFGRWSLRVPPDPYGSVQAIHALLLAKDAGYEVSQTALELGNMFLRNVGDNTPASYSQANKNTLEAYALAVRALGGDKDPSGAAELWHSRGSELGLDALAWIWPVVEDPTIAEEIGRIFANRVTETANAATFVTDYDEDAYLILASDRRTDALVLDALISVRPDSDLIPKLVNGLLASRIKGRWNNVQENSFVSLALHKYFRAFEDTVPDFVARVWLGGQYLAEHDFSGRSTDRAATLVPMNEVVALVTPESNSTLVVQNDGVGRLYYRLGLQYVPANLTQDPLDRGFVVQRSYEAVDDSQDVWLDTDGTVHVALGAQVRVNVTMVNDSRRTNMALVDPLAAGFETVNSSLAVTATPSSPSDSDTDSTVGWWWNRWFEHENLRDDRSEAFASYLPAGTYEYSYVVRATAPGVFVVPPAKAEEIYAPEVFGRSRSHMVVVEEAADVS